MSGNTTDSGGSDGDVVGLPDEPLGTLAIVALSCYLGLSSLYFVVIHAWPGYHGPALFWREETITIAQSSAKDEHLPERDSAERSNEPIAPQPERETRAKLYVVAEPHTTVVITAPTLRWAEVTLQTASINALQACRGPASLAIFLGASVSQIITFLRYVDALVGFAGVMSSVIGFISLMALVCFVQSMRMMYHLTYLAMVMPRRDKTKDEIAAEALGLAVGIADHTATEMERQGEANAMKDELVDHAASAMLEASRSVAVMSFGSVDFAAATILLENPSLVLEQTANQLRLRRPKPLCPVPHDATAALDPATAAIIRDEDARRPQTPGVHHLLRRRQSRGGVGFETAVEVAGTNSEEATVMIEVTEAPPTRITIRNGSGESLPRVLRIEKDFPSLPVPEYAFPTHTPPAFEALAASIGRELQKPATTTATTSVGTIATASENTVETPLPAATNAHPLPRRALLSPSSTSSGRGGGDVVPSLKLSAPPHHSVEGKAVDGTFHQDADHPNQQLKPPLASLHHHRSLSVNSLAAVSVRVGANCHRRTHSAGSFMDESDTDDCRDPCFHPLEIDVENVAIANLLVGPAHAQGAEFDASLPPPPPPGQEESCSDAAAVIELTKKQQYAAKILAHLALEEHYSFREHELRMSEVARLMSWNCALGLRLMVLLLPPVLGLFHEGALLAASVLVMPLLVYVDACY